ncbi:M56 family metallopeptidase [Chryseobacterium foetidum]|uniref:M56 family metallopeptidase n=1 Tax=Chryseobacterium foetidum TaxID=2951057 RepID=UPI0021C6FCAE|nr:M56 family metallopeptidase [Chryseobacterium foetidum]
METLVLKIVICSGILLGLYHLLLSKEKTFVFNRFYLIFSVIFSLTIPFLTIELPELNEDKPTLLIEQEISQPILTGQIVEEKSFDLNQILLTTYCLIAVFFLAKFIFSVLKIKNLKGRKIIYKSKKIVLLKRDLAPFSFWNTIYISEKSFTDSGIDERVFMHEEIHIQQKHSLDLVFIELTKAVLWINPFFYFYKNAMINNHEFLADEEVINKKNDIKNYQELILQEVLKQQNLSLTHQFNFNNTKKRFIMMTKQNSKFAKVKKFLAVPVFAIAAFVFAEKVYGNNVGDLKNDYGIKSNATKLSLNHSEAYKEFIKIIERYEPIIKNRDHKKFTTEVPREVQVKLADLFDNFNSTDLIEAPIWVKYTEISREIPTINQMNKFLISSYKIEIDGKLVDNKVLKNYKNTDFYNVYILKVIPTNPDYGKYDYGVVLYTKAFAKKYNAAKKITVSFKVDMAEYKQWVKNDTISPKKNKDAKVSQPKKEKITKTIFEDFSETKTIPPPPPPSANFVQADFPGGIHDLRVKIAENFDSSLFDKKTGIISTSIFISVDENGKTTDVIADGEDIAFNTEAVRTVKLATNNKPWKPAKDNGKNVKTVFKLPLKMQFATNSPAK